MALKYAKTMEDDQDFKTAEDCLNALLAETSDPDDRLAVRKMNEALGTKPPAVLNNSSPAVQCAVVARIGRKKVRILLDTGAVQSMISSEAAQALSEDPESAPAMSEPMALKQPLNCEGAEKGRVIGRVEWAIKMRINFDPPETPETHDDPDPAHRLGKLRAGPRAGSVLGQFYMVDNLSDGLILGLPEMSQLGAYVEPMDDSGRYWVQFTSLGGLRLPLISSRRSGAKVKLVDLIEADGPALLQARSILTKEEYDVHVE